MSKLTSWWGKKWAEAVSLAAPEPIPRGRGRPKGARLRSLDATTGEATVEVQTTSVLPYEVRIAVAPIDEAVWGRAIAELRTQSVVAAKLLAGEMPTGLEDALVRAGGSLFPTRGEVKLRCNCPAGSSGCRHGAAAERTLAETIDRDPFLLLDLRGRPRTVVLEALGVRGARIEKGEGEKATAAETEAATAPVDAAEFRRARGDLAAVHFHIAPPETSLALLQRLGDPPGWKGPPSLIEAVGAAVESAAERARKIAEGE